MDGMFLVVDRICTGCVLDMVLVYILEILNTIIIFIFLNALFLVESDFSVIIQSPSTRISTNAKVQESSDNAVNKSML